MSWKPVIKEAMCPHCKQIVDLAIVGNEVRAQDLDIVFVDHAVGDDIGDQRCHGSKTIVGYDTTRVATDEIIRLRDWLEEIVHTPHSGCNKAEPEDSNCGACRAKAALSGMESPSYSNMNEPDPPSEEEILEGQIKSSGGVIARSALDVPGVECWVILRYGIFRMVPTTFVTYRDKSLWLTEVKRLAATRETFTAFVARPVSTTVTVNVDVVDGAP